jgi:hypothetical protein
MTPLNMGPLIKAVCAYMNLKRINSSIFDLSNTTLPPMSSVMIYLSSLIIN